ncbi:N-acetylmuramoyl-L-alanine amidase [Helcococcus kunzii]|uniref:N-acetylmuramoyl-L-alanine amidase n=1 Tax=Helcococcus kunzii TaxID=40091 RepID=UPI0038ADE31F
MNYKKTLLLFSLTILMIIFGAGFSNAANLDTAEELPEKVSGETIKENKTETLNESVDEKSNETSIEDTYKETETEEEINAVDSKEDITRKNTIEESTTNTESFQNQNSFEISDFQVEMANVKSGSRVSEGWNYDGSNWKYLDKSGNPVISKWVWAPILDKDGKRTGKFNWKYFNYKGNNINQFYIENGKIWLSQETPTKQYLRGWWTNPDNGYRYFFRLSSGTRVSGRQFIDGNWRFFRTTGTLAYGRQFIKGGWSYFREETGAQAFGWQFYNGAWRYNDPDDFGHEYHSVWKYMPLNDKNGSHSWKYFNKNGENIYHIFNENNNSYLSQPGPNSGFGKGWWKNPSTNQNYYFRYSTGTMVKRWQYIDGMWRFFRNSGTQAFGLQFVNGEFVYLRQGTGSHALGRQFVNGKWMDFGEHYDYRLEKYVNGNGQASDILGDNNTTKTFKLVIDPGHGGGIKHNRGGVLFNEGDQNYRFAQAILKEAFRYKDVEVTTTRPNIDDDPSFEDRAKAGSGADLFVSVHTNAADKYVRGVEIWGSQKNTKLGHDFAIDITNTWSKLLNTPNRGVMYDYRDQNEVLRNLYYPDNTKEDTWFIYKGNTAKQKILLESVFHTNYDDSSVFLKNQELLAREFMAKVSKHFGIKLK